MNLHLLQLGDSALPIGGYSHSWGLEAAIEGGLVRDPHTLEYWVRHWLRHVVGPFEGVIVAGSCRSAATHDWDLVLDANELLSASLSPPSLRHASREMGEQLMSLAESWPSHEAVAVYLHQAALGVISAGVRGIPIGHTHGQQIVARLHHDLEALATELAGKGLETAGTFCPAYETLCHAQTRLYTRLFRS
jgi:urease accessory protein